MSLVPAYASSSEDDESHSSEDEETTENRITKQRKQHEPIALPSASLLLSGISNSTTGHVFNNPYKDAENAKIASLEKHVKMVSRTPETTQEITEDNRPTFSNQPNVKKKKRPGLGNSIVPSKKVMKHYQQTKSSK